MATANSARLKRQMLRSASTWIRPVTAISTTAARTGCGSVRSSPVKNSTTTSVMSAATSPESGVRAPAVSLTSDCDMPPLTGQSAAEPGHEIGAADGQEFLRGVESIAVLGGEHPPDGRRFHGREHEARHGQRHDLVDVRPA